MDIYIYIYIERERDGRNSRAHVTNSFCLNILLLT